MTVQNQEIVEVVPLGQDTGDANDNGGQGDGAEHGDRAHGDDISRQTVPSEFPPPAVLANDDELVWDDAASDQDNYAAAGQALAKAGDIFRRADYAGGLWLASPVPSIPPTAITKAADLAAIFADRLNVKVVKKGEVVAHRVPAVHLSTMLQAEIFLQQFQAIDVITPTPLYSEDFQQLTPGYNAGPPRQRFFFIGGTPSISNTHDIIDKFLHQICFASNADLAAAVAAGLLVRLRNHWLGGKPLVPITANKSHAGKGTVAQFIAGRNPVTAIIHEATDWAFKRQVIGALRQNPELAMLNLDNARIERGTKVIKSAFLESFLTDSQPFLFSTNTGPATRRANDIVVTTTTNEGNLSVDLLNRSMPIHLVQTGNIEDRACPLGNLKYEFLPDNVNEIESEFHGLIHRWLKEGRPLDNNVKHPFAPCMRVLGGILMVNGYTDFLGNYSIRRIADDPIAKALGVLGAASPGEAWAPASYWATLAGDLGLCKLLIPEADRDGDKARARGMGSTLAAHEAETIRGSTETHNLLLRLELVRRRFDGKPQQRYRFVVLDKQALPLDDSGSKPADPAETPPQ